MGILCLDGPVGRLVYCEKECRDWSRFPSRARWSCRGKEESRKSGREPLTSSSCSRIGHYYSVEISKSRQFYINVRNIYLVILNAQQLRGRAKMSNPDGQKARLHDSLLYTYIRKAENFPPDSPYPLSRVKPYKGSTLDAGGILLYGRVAPQPPARKQKSK